MNNYARTDEINMLRKQLQREKEAYEDCYNKFKQEMEAEYHEFYRRLQDITDQDDEIYEMNDKRLLHLIEDNRDSFKGVEDACGELLITVDDECKNYLYEYACKDEELQRDLNRLELV